jgi:fibulin 1/2
MDECQDGTSTCQETCTNTMGSYICGCNEGFRLNSDGRTCYGRSII